MRYRFVFSFFPSMAASSTSSQSLFQPRIHPGLQFHWHRLTCHGLFISIGMPLVWICRSHTCLWYPALLWISCQSGQVSECWVYYVHTVGSPIPQPVLFPPSRQAGSELQPHAFPLPCQFSSWGMESISSMKMMKGLPGSLSKIFLSLSSLSP